MKRDVSGIRDAGAVHFLKLPEVASCFRRSSSLGASADNSAALPLIGSSRFTCSMANVAADTPAWLFGSRPEGHVHPD